MEREQFTFYRSYYEALKKLSKRDREQAIMAICAYALDEEIIPLSGPASVMFLLVLAAATGVATPNTGIAPLKFEHLILF